MKRQPRLTKRERKEANPKKPAQPSTAQGHAEHIHCIACGRHLDQSEFTQAPVTATYIRCDHGSLFPSCVACSVTAETLVQAHDRSGQPVKTAKAWH